MKPSTVAKSAAGKTAAKKSSPKKTAVSEAVAVATKPVAKKAVAGKTAAPKPAANAPAKKAPSPAAAPKKEKLVRDSFTMPRADFALIDALKARAIAFGRPVKKSELLRAGLQALAALDAAALKARIEGLAPVKAGRPKKAD